MPRNAWNRLSLDRTSSVIAPSVADGPIPSTLMEEITMPASTALRSESVSTAPAVHTVPMKPPAKLAHG